MSETLSALLAQAERVWPDDFDCGFKHAMKTAGRHYDLPAAFRWKPTP